MVVAISWILIWGFTINLGIADPSRCISSKTGNTKLVKNQLCTARQKDVELLCPPTKIILITSLQSALKNTSLNCMKRILNLADAFCCNVQDSDVLYDGQCLADVLNTEDKTHYKEFMTTALRQCWNTSECVLRSQLFSYLQRKIPSTKQKEYSSYFQITHQCIKAPDNIVHICSSMQHIGKDLYLQSGVTSEVYKNSCMCQMTSRGGGKVTIRAMDVRIASSVITMSSGKQTESINELNSPLYGFQEIFSGSKINISVTLQVSHSDDVIWLLLSGANGEDVNVTCGETKQDLKEVSFQSHPVITDFHDASIRVFGEHWPLVYVASGSIFTILLVACTFTGLFVCRHRKNHSRRHLPCIHSTLPSPADFHQDPFTHHYTSVLSEHHTTDLGHLSISDDVYGKTCSTSPYTACLHPPTPHPSAHPANAPAGRCSYTRRGISDYTLSDVSELEAFLECADNEPRSPKTEFPNTYNFHSET